MLYLDYWAYLISGQKELGFTKKNLISNSNAISPICENKWHHVYKYASQATKIILITVLLKLKRKRNYQMEDAGEEQNSVQ